MEFKTLIYEAVDGIATVTFNRPEAMNSSNARSVAELNQVVDMIEADDSVRVAIMWGGTKVFAAGGDIKYMSEADPLEMEKFIAGAHAMHDKIAASP